MAGRLRRAQAWAGGRATRVGGRLPVRSWPRPGCCWGGAGAAVLEARLAGRLRAADVGREGRQVRSGRAAVLRVRSPVRATVRRPRRATGSGLPVSEAWRG